MVERAMSITTTTVNESNQLNIDIDSTLMPSFDDHENTITTTTATTTTTTTLPPPSTPTAPSTTSARPSFPCIPEPIQCALFLNKHYVIYSAFGSFYIPMFVMIFFYWRIYLVAIRTSRALKRGYRTTKTTGDGSNEERLTLRIHRGYDCNESNDQMNITTSSSSFNNSRTNKKKNKIGKNSMDGRVRTRVPITIYKATTRTSTTSTMGCDSSGSEVASGAAGGGAAAGDGGGRRQSTLIVNHLSISGGHGGGGGAIKSTSSNTLSPGDHNMSQTDNRLNNGQQHHHHHHNRRNSPGCQSTLSLPFSSSSPSSSRESSARSNQVVMARLSKRTSKYQAKRFHAETKAAKTVGIIVGGFIVCWLPFFTVYLIRAFCGDCISKLVFQIFFWLGYCNSMINPCIYGLFSRDFRRAFRNILCRCKFGEETSVSSLIRQIHMPTFFEDMPEEMAKQESQEY
ncbi:hypothetical protein RDWZM_000852 [Blomia tropicalis]|uniref:G-protein coupled receptors family 1 profile domain-containing protein n=1 Tax=Blomia tropicalis TaxID=40697 RepID=A0A9Q0MB45_BLOTA|nr:hypothetical protein RDWZM_000852 [Blomia tropicalis]